ncbi:MAG: rhomboid family intramembrane serine protease [Chloroflexi bacterium]|nr:rhomboid family intramembrane serine protease [Chloroflexota bacterium]
MSHPAATGPSGPPSLADAARSGRLDPAVAVGLLQRAQQMAEDGDWEHAAITFSRVVGNDDPNLHIAALLGLAECRYRLDDEPAAIQAWISATQAPEGPLSWRAWQQLAASRVRGGDLTGAARAYREAERRAPASERPEIASRLGWLSKETGDSGAAQRYFARSRASGVIEPRVTWAILMITVAISVFTFLADDGTVYRFLRLSKVGVADGEYWRLFTVVLVHGGWIHLLLNMYALFLIGPTVEALYGPVRFLGIYLACAAAGSAASYVFSAAPNSVGASGAIFGLFGVLLVADRVHKPALTRQARNLTMQIGVLIAVNLVIGFSIPAIDNAAHVGGLIAGCWLGLALVPRDALTLGSFWSSPTGGPVRSGRIPISPAMGAVVGLLVVGVAVGAMVLLVGPQPLRF